MSEVTHDTPNTDQDAPLSNEEIIAQLKAENQKLANHNATLFAEKKKGQEQKREIEEQAEADRLAKLAEKGDYKALLDTTKQELDAWKNKYEDLTNKQKQGKVDETIKSVANELFGKEVFSKLIGDMFAYSDETGGVLMNIGGATYSDVNQMKEAIKGMSEFKDMIVTSKSSGGGAISNNSNVISRKSLKEMSGMEQVKLARENPELYKQLVKGN